MSSLKTKFISLVTLLIILVVIVTSGILVNQKRMELESDIYFNARSFAELSSDPIIKITNEFLLNGNFVFFKRDLNELLKKNPDILNVRIYKFSGEILFDSATDTQRTYQGAARIASNEDELFQIKLASMSALTKSGEILILEKISGGDYEILNRNNQPVAKAAAAKMIRSLDNIVRPIDGQFAIEYEITYKNLIKRLTASAYQIILIGLIAIVASGLFGYTLASLVTRPLKKLTTVVGEIAKGDFAKRVNVKTHDEVGDLAESVNQMAGDLEKATEAKIYKERVKKELEIAAKIQKDLLPTNLPEIEGLDLAAEVIPATEVGGDVYDILFDADNDPYFYVGDVTGHGVPAGLLSSVANAIVSSTVEFQDIRKIVSNLNRVLKKKTAGNLFLTLLLVKFLGKGKFEFISAGHEKLLHYSAKTGSATYLDASGIALGLFPEIEDKLELKTIELAQGDFIALYTDGIPEAWKSDSEQFGFEPFAALATKHGNLQTATQIKDAILTDLKSYMGGYEQKDDITLMILRVV